MALNKQLTKSIVQTTGSCMIISYSICFNYFTGFGQDQIINEFINNNDHLFDLYSIDRKSLNDESLEKQFADFHDKVVHKSCQRVQFNNNYIETSLREFAESNNIQTELINNVIDESISARLINDESCLSLSCELPIKINKPEWHATPIGYYSEFHTIYRGEIINFGQNMVDGVTRIFNPLQFGDGIMFSRK
jgi:hypothetical protein